MDKNEYKKDAFLDSSFVFSPNNSSFTGDIIISENRTSSVESVNNINQTPNITKIEKNTNIK